MRWSTECIYFRPGRDMDYWSLILDLSYGIGTRARQRDSSSCEHMCIYKCRVFYPNVLGGNGGKDHVARNVQYGSPL